MDFAKYVALLETGALWFSRADMLGESFGDRLGDPFEGTLSHPTVAELRQKYIEFKSKSGETLSEEQLNERVDHHIRLNRFIREWTYVSSWHMNERESAAMWHLYARSNEGVAIQSTYAKLRWCLPQRYPKAEGIPAAILQGEAVVGMGLGVNIGRVQYLDYATEAIPEYTFLHPLFFKIKSFEHAQELRAVTGALPLVKKPGDRTPPHAWAMRNPELGRSVTVLLDKLIENVYVAPTAPAWFVEVVAAVTRKYGLANKPIRSALDETPLL